MSIASAERSSELTELRLSAGDTGQAAELEAQIRRLQGE